MKPKLILPLIALLSLPAAARPDAGLPRFNLDIKIRFENLDEYPDHDFYLKYGLSRRNPTDGLRWTKLDSGALTQLEGPGDQKTAVFLVALPRGTPPPPVPKENRQDWLAKAPPGGLQSAALQGVGNGSEITYRAHIDGDTLSAEFVDSVNPFWRTVMLICGSCCLTVFILGSVVTVFLVWWLWRRP
jgi:hypothetical protein